MWTRKELKERGKSRFFATYWKTLLVALILTFIAGGSGGSAGRAGSSSDEQTSSIREITDKIEDEIHKGNLPKDFDDIKEGLDEYNDDGIDEDPAESLGDYDYKLDEILDSPGFMAAMTGIVTVVIIVVLVICVVATALKIFVFNPLILGCQNYFVRNLDEDCGLNYVGSGFTNNYLNGVKVMFLKGLYTFLWSLLFIIPGIIKSYEYRMIPYLLAENPDMTAAEAFAESKRMMDGQKWNAFVLDLSFIGWYLLTALTLGILGVFFTNPYKYQTDAALYEALRDNGNASYGVPTQDYAEV